MRRIGLAVALVAALVPATAVSAAGCGADFDLKTIDATLNDVDERIYNATEWLEIVALVESVDANGDGLLCSKQFKPNQGQDKQWIGPEDVGVTDYVITLIGDNKAQGRS